MGSPPFAARGGRRSTTLALVAGLLIATAACRRVNGPAAPPPEAPGETAAGGAALAPGPLPEALAAGRLVVMAQDLAAERNQAQELDPGTGAWRPLWATSTLGNVADWRPAPDGRRVVYRIIQRSSPEDAVEALILRDLRPEAPARTLVVVDAGHARLAGFAWAPEGDRVAFGLQELPGGSDGGAGDPGGWSLRSVVVDAVGAPAGDGSGAAGTATGGRLGTLLWRAPAAPDRPLELALEAYDPARSRAAVSELAADSGIVASLRLIDLAQGAELAAVPVTLAGLAPAAGPGRLALAEGAPLADHLRLLDLADGGLRELLRPPTGATLGRPLWSADGRRLALALYPVGVAAATEILVLDPDRDSPTARFTLPGSNAAPLAFSPDGRWLLAQPGEADEAFGARLVLLPAEGGEPSPARVTLPAGAWALSWLPD